MRGQRAPLDENGDGEVDENFWAQAAADQAAGLATSGDEGAILSSLPLSRRLSDIRY
jgi:condensin complex subunit 2